MQVAFSLTRRDIVHLNWHLFWRRSGNIVFAAALIYFFYQTVNHVSKVTLAYVASSFAVSVLGAIAISLLWFGIGVVFVLLRSTVRKGTLGEHRYELTDNGIREVTVANDSLHLWGAIKNIAKSNGYIRLQVTRSLFHVIPLRAFAKPEDFDAFYERAQALRVRAQPGAPADAGALRRLFRRFARRR